MAGSALSTLRRVAKRGLYRTTPRVTGHAGAPSVVVAYNELGAYCLPRAALHRPACRAVMQGQVWERETLQFLCEHCGDGDIVHAGTFFGDFLPALSRAAAPGAKLWAFEPLAESWRCAKATAALNDLANVELRHAALGDSAEPVALRTLDKDGLPLGGAAHVGGGTGGELAPQARIDDTVPAERRVSLIQLDVEGFEGAALAGAAETLRRWRPLVVVESLPPEFAEAHGYVFDRLVDGNAVLRPAD
ncbi:MAG TPA: FkbM family methyltransferase [Caulobacteraceae bacterium]|jgi:FkbM family methyltransferase|nr:FkbM family methyltransferase [Caulobacteraceae bacterium]